MSLSLGERSLQAVAAGVVAAVVLPGGAQATVTISNGATVNIACTAGVCTPSKKAATFNVTQLENLPRLGQRENHDSRFQILGYPDHGTYQLGERRHADAGCLSIHHDRQIDFREWERRPHNPDE